MSWRILYGTGAKGGPGLQGVPQFEFSSYCGNKGMSVALSIPARYLVVRTQEQMQGIYFRLLVDGWQRLRSADDEWHLTNSAKQFS
jgi:hypothetical protein